MPLPLLLAAALAVSAAAPASAAPQAVPVSTTAAKVNPLAREPLYADIVRQAGVLRDTVQGARGAGSPAPDLAKLQADLTALAALDMQGHVDLAQRGTDGDLKCILKGISQDLPKKLADLKAAADAPARAAALEDLYYLLRDNVEVITTPPSVHS